MKEGVKLGRRRLIKSLLTILLLLFLAVLLYKFRPKVWTPKAVNPGKAQGAKKETGQLTAKGFRYVQEKDGRISYIVTADNMTQQSGGERLLENPVITFPSSGGHEDKVVGRKGVFQPVDQTLRVWDRAKVLQWSGWVSQSSGYRLTPEEEVVSEGPVTLHRGGIDGSAQLMRFQKDTDKAYLEGDVRFRTPEGRVFTCRRMALDLRAHSGKCTGPVSFQGPEGTLSSPDARLVLDASNRLRGLIMGMPCRGEGPSGTVSAAQMHAYFDVTGQVRRLEWREQVRLATAAAPPTTLSTQELVLTPLQGPAWNWQADREVVFHQGGNVLHARSGSGRFGGRAPLTAVLPGPVNGSGPSGTATAKEAKIQGDTRVLIGNVDVVRGRDTLKAETVTWAADGGYRAETNVKGVHYPAGPGEPWRFTSDEAEAAASGYPLVIEGRARARRGDLELSAPHIRMQEEDRVEAWSGVVARWTDPKQPATLVGGRLVYNGKAQTLAATDGAKANGRGYALEGRTVTAYLDKTGNPDHYLAEGTARFDGPLYEGRGDRLTYRPAKESGTAHSEAGRSVVVKKKPYRRMEGRTILFTRNAITVTEKGQGMQRGVIEGSVPRKKEP